MSSKILLLNNATGGGDTPSPSATLVNDQLYCHLDARDIKSKLWNDRKGNFNFVSDALLGGIDQTAYNLTCKKSMSHYKRAYCNEFTFGEFPFTLEFTMTATAIGSYGVLCANTTDSLFALNRRGNDYMGIYSSKMSPNNKPTSLRYDALTDNTLHIVDFIFANNHQLDVYLDGVLQGSLTDITFNNEFVTITSLALGNKSDSSNECITGYLYSFRFYKKALSDFEIRCNCLYEAAQGRTSTSEASQSQTFINKW